MTRNQFFNHLHCCGGAMRLDYLHPQDERVGYGFICDRCGLRRRGARDKQNGEFSIEHVNV